MSTPEPATPTWRPSPWPRLLVFHALQLLPLCLALFGEGSTVLWVAGLAGSAIACAATDSGWRWLNRLLVLEAVAWLLVPLLLATT